MNKQPQAQLLFARQGEHLRTVRDFKDLRGAKARPTDLTCPECDHGVTVKLSPTHQVVDHFAHLPDADCRLREGGESAEHLNAKAGLALWLARYHKMALSYKCVACQGWQNYLKFEDYDQVIPELKLGKRRPDISVLNSGEAVGAAEIRHTHKVTFDKHYDLNALGINWFEIPTTGAHKKFYNVNAIDGEWFTIDARAAGVLFPAAPNYCEVCGTARRRSEEKLAAQSQFQNDWKRAQALLPLPERYNQNQERMEAAVAQIRADDMRRKEQEAIMVAEYDIWAQRDGKPYLMANGELITPTNCEYKYRWWKPGGQSKYVTLAELKAPLATWKRHAYSDPFLLTEKHTAHCSGVVKSGADFSFCAECGYYLEGVTIND